jgi:hypothetical protein
MHSEGLLCRGGWVKLLDHKADQALPPSAKIRMVELLLQSPKCMAYCLIRYRENFTLLLLYTIITCTQWWILILVVLNVWVSLQGRVELFAF